MGRRRDDPVSAAGTRLMETLLEDEDFVAHVAAAEIQRRIDAGELIEAEKLQLGGGLQLASSVRLGALERFVARVAEAGELDAEALSDLVWAATELAEGAIIDTSTAPAETAAADEPVDELEARRRPAGMPAEGDEPHCERCDTIVPVPFAQLVWSRWRKVYCNPCLEHFDEVREQAKQEAATG